MVKPAGYLVVFSWCVWTLSFISHAYIPQVDMLFLLASVMLFDRYVPGAEHDIVNIIGMSAM